MNIIGGLCRQLKTLLDIYAGQEGRFDAEATMEKLIEYCDIAMADLRVSPLRQLLEEEGQKSPHRK
jgi:hypothetical protein